MTTSKYLKLDKSHISDLYMRIKQQIFKTTIIIWNYIIKLEYMLKKVSKFQLNNSHIKANILFHVKEMPSIELIPRSEIILVMMR